ncbi:hypothetical protein SARC_00361 [Sphaeroforma arctica JP610]|uniref:ubiquitinyl hydrolase 1 n=1 Tax=Sphaeroforma arctica JP610 TaxID=667725 RepID=A0A0L0GEV5_9EUKA|nr:hypothetical protein SARC_00361 [Sphaeroforma arctica JP610]KNC87537.1 hypothetical protein SARC_00361 [Sphaeroforma arctica JP610]|eukprot:XP_014161439.1 hypothetical protein SARC_00361 [Sphaeroforma arctica JP610]
MDNSNPLLLALKDELDDVLQALVTRQTINVEWPNYPSQLMWNLNVSPQWDCMLLYTVTFEEISSHMGVIFYPKFNRVMTRDYHAVGTPQRAWQDSVETFLEINRQPDRFVDMKTLLTDLDDQLTATQNSAKGGRASLGRRRSSALSYDFRSPFDSGATSGSGKNSPAPGPPTPRGSNAGEKKNTRPLVTVPVGLPNAKNQNLCFMNSVSQALAHSFFNGKLRPLLAQLSHREPTDPAVAKKQPVVKTLYPLLESLANNAKAKSKDEPQKCMDAFRVAMSAFPESNVQKPKSGVKQQQQDVHEWLTFVLQTLEAVAATSEERLINFDTFDDLIKGTATVHEVMADLQWNERFSVGAAQFAASLAYQTITAYYCGNCRVVTQVRPDINNILSLSVGSETSETTVQALFNETVSSEPLDGWRCGACNTSHPDTSRINKFFRMPTFLIVHIVRTQLDMTTGELGKSQRPVRIGNITCELPTQLLPRQASEKKHALVTYSPVSVVTHLGAEMRSGHYTCFSSLENKTILFDDDTISDFGTDVPEKHTEILQKNSALIFYIRE